MSARRPTRLTTKAFTGAALSLALAAAVLANPSQAFAADDEPAFDTKIIRGIMENLGLQKEERSINYQERAPLVVPPSRTLPPPEAPGASVANNPAWPKDPDVLRAKQEAARERSAFSHADDQIRNEQRPLRPDEMTPGPKPRTASRAARSTQAAGSSSETNPRLTPSQLGYSGGLFGMFGSSKDDDVARFTGEPPRTSLTEPPPGYQTPSPDQPYGVTDQAKAPKAEDSYNNHGVIKQ